MDQSMDSIGSCSLDVEADFADVSETSGSLNVTTPISVKDIPKEFTTNIRERCLGQNFHEINNKGADFDSKMISTQPLRNVISSSALMNSNKIINFTDVGLDKKPSYLNLACCVNGYSNLTTYDSKIRQDINKSREVSPIRPSSNSIQHCKKSNSLAPPILLQMRDGSGHVSTWKPPTINSHAYNNEINYFDPLSQKDSHNTSFIQQRVERLYGPAALAQGFYSPKKVRSGTACTPRHECEDVGLSELALKFQKLTPSKDYTGFRKKMDTSASNTPRQVIPSTAISNINNTVDLPVLRHLSQEFRAQLPIISPIKAQSRKSFNRSFIVENDFTVISKKIDISIDEVDREQLKEPVNEISNGHARNGLDKNDGIQVQQKITDLNTSCIEKDGHYFLDLLKRERKRILALADIAEQYCNELANNHDVSEDTLGFLRSAYGKARLLVSQKIKQFEGLCQNNLNSSPEDKFPTTNDDLQGFWDMLNLQICHINSIFDEIEVLKSNNWKTTVDDLRDLNKPTKISQKCFKAVNRKTKPNKSNGSEVKTNTTNSVAVLKRESQRKMLQEIKRKNRLAISSKTATSEKKSLESNAEVTDVVEVFGKCTRK